MIDNCDMCGSKIVEGKCDCGTWIPAEEAQKDPFTIALHKFNDMKRMAITGDAPHLGCAFVFFRGDYTDCKEIEDFIHKKKNRPYYEDHQK